MRSIVEVIDQIAPLLPSPAPPEVADNLIVLAAELRILRRAGAYTPPEAPGGDLWQRLETALYRYLPNPGAYPWSSEISKLVTARK